MVPARPAKAVRRTGAPPHGECHAEHRQPGDSQCDGSIARRGGRPGHEQGDPCGGRNRKHHQQQDAARPAQCAYPPEGGEDRDPDASHRKPGEGGCEVEVPQLVDGADRRSGAVKVGDPLGEGCGVRASRDGHADHVRRQLDAQGVKNGRSDVEVGHEPVPVGRRRGECARQTAARGDHWAERGRLVVLLVGRRRDHEHQGVLGQCAYHR